MIEFLDTTIMYSIGNITVLCFLSFLFGVAIHSIIVDIKRGRKNG